MAHITHKLALIGFGTVGQSLAKIIAAKNADLKQLRNTDLQIVAVATPGKGSLYHPAGLDISALFAALEKDGTFAGYPDSAGLERGWSNLALVRDSNADTIVEVSHTDMNTGQPALDHCRTALAHGKNVVTSNKGPVALAYADLAALAAANGVRFLFESTVTAGTPSLRLARRALAGNEITEMRGILNGTTNFILSEMETGKSYADALAEAQALGYAEADPTADVEGIDALAKVLIVANTVMGCALTKDEISCRGISQLTADDVAAAKTAGKRWKLIGHVKKAGGQTTASVQPVQLPLSDPLAQVMGTTNAITYRTDLLGDVTLVGPGAGGIETAAGLLADILAI